MSKGDTTRDAILVKGLGIASELGLESLSIGQLAKAVGMSKSGLFAHFKSKEQLQLSVLQVAIDQFVARVVAPALREPRGEPRVRALLDRFLCDWEEFLPGGCIFVTAAIEYDDRPGPVRDFLRSAQRDWLDVLAGAARRAVDQGDFLPDLDVDQFAFEAHSLVLGYHHQRRLLRDPRAENRLKVACESLIRRSRA